MSASRIEEVVNDYVNLKRRGVNLIGLCPFHNEKTPSFTVSPSKNLYKCFGCGKGGNPVSFLMEHEKFSYPEALRYLASKYHIQVEETARDKETIQKELERESLYLINEFAKEFFQDQLHNSDQGKQIGLSYFKHRGLLDHTIKKFALGYSPKDPSSFSSSATKAGYKKESLQLLGLVTKNNQDFFRERVIFPFFNLSGKVIGFGGRILNDHVKRPKYLNSAESDLFNKRKTLYGLYQAKGQIRKEDECILVEGYTDVLSLHQNGIENAVASSGTSLTPEQVQLMKRFTNNVLVLYDGDQAGQNAALRGLNICIDHGLDVSIVMLPEKADPDSYIREVGSSKFKEYLTGMKKDLILLLAQNVQQTYGSDPIQKTVHTRDIVESIGKIRDQLKRSLYIKECAGILNIEEAILIREVNKQIKSEIQQKQRTSRRPDSQEPLEPMVEVKKDHSPNNRIEINYDEYQEKDIIRVLIQGGEEYYDDENSHTIGEYIISNVMQISDLFKSDLYREILDDYATELSNGRQPDQSFFLNHSNPDIQKVAREFLFEPYYYADWSSRGVELQTQKPKEENFQKDGFQAISRFKLKKINERLKELEGMLAVNDANKMNAILLAIKKLQEERKELADKQGITIL
jgi:DNA primase